MQGLRDASGIVPHTAVRAGLVLLRGVAPPEVTASDIYRGIIPFVGMQVLATGIVFAFPSLALWLPKTIGW